MDNKVSQRQSIRAECLDQVFGALGALVTEAYREIEGSTFSDSHVRAAKVGVDTLADHLDQWLHKAE